MLTMEGGVFELTRFCSAISPPNVARVLAQATTTMAASGAAALAHSASRIASPSSPATTPGARQLLAPVAGAGLIVVSVPAVYFDRPKVERKVYQSEDEYRSVSSMTAIVWPEPVVPAAKSGFKL